MTIGAAILLNILVIIVWTIVGIAAAIALAVLVWALLHWRSDAKKPASTLDTIESDLSRLDRLDGLGGDRR